MSAETELDRAAVLANAMRVKRVRPPLQPGELEFWQRDRRSPDPIARLSRDHDTLAREAVDPAEIAAGLEAAGLNDRIAREQFQEESVFRIAELVYECVPRKVVDPLALDYDPWSQPFWNHLARGLLYALPTLPYVVAIGFTKVTPAGIWLLLITCVLSTAFTQGLAHIVHVFLGYGVRRAAVRVLRIALVGVIVLGGLLATWIALSTTAGLLVTAIAHGVMVYVVAATVLMVFKRERLLLAALTPAILLSLAVLLAPGHLLAFPYFVGGVLLLSVLAVVGVAGWVLADEHRPRGAKWMPLARPEWAGAALHAAYGAVAAALMIFAVVDVLSFDNPISASSVIGVGMLPLVVSLGFAEANVYGFRSECSTALAASYTRQEFGPAARRVMRRRLGAYVATLVVLTGIVVVPSMLMAGSDPITLMRHLAYAELGVALLGAMMLVSCGMAKEATILLGIGLVVDMLIRIPLTSSLELLTAGHVLVFAALIVLVWWAAFRDLASPQRHR